MLLIVSDGNDTGSTHSFSEALEEVQRSGTVVYAIQYPDAVNGDISSGDLQRLADATGGMLFHLQGADYSDPIARIVSDLHGRYVLGFRPESTSSDSLQHTLRVDVLRPRATVRARRGYSGP